MPNDRSFDPMQVRSDRRVFRQIWQRGGIMAKKQYPLLGAEIRERIADALQVLVSNREPFFLFFLVDMLLPNSR